MQDNRVSKVTKVILDSQERKESKDQQESQAHLDPKDQPVLLETRDQEPRESLENPDSKETLEQMGPQDQRGTKVTLETQVHLEYQVLLGLLETKVPRVRLERKVTKEMKVLLPRPCAWSRAPTKAEWRCFTMESGGRSATIALITWTERSSAECWDFRA